MVEKPDHHLLYQSISDLIDYCSLHQLHQTEDVLTVAIAMLCQEEGKNNSISSPKVEPAHLI